MDVDQSMFHYIEVLPIGDKDYFEWLQHIDKIGCAAKNKHPNLTLAIAMYMKKNGYSTR